jgi:hypothetical protein
VTVFASASKMIGTTSVPSPATATPTVVDHEEHDREVPEGGEVQRFVPGAHVYGTVAQLAEHRLALVLTYERERETGRHRQLTRDDAPSPVEAA